MVSALLCFLWSFLIAVFAIPSIISVAHLKRLLDEPNLRTVHISLTPRLGGIAIFAGFTSALTIFGDFDKEIQQVVAGSVILFFIGLKDDIITVSVFKKFFVQVLSAGIVVFIGDIRITDFYGILGWHEVPVGISYLFTFFVIIGITNAFNLIDGIDGLAGSIGVLICTVFGFFFYFEEVGNSGYFANLAFSLAGGLIGFLRYNINKAIIFMGDTGSLVCGFIVAVFAIKFIQFNFVPSSPTLAVATLIIPITDTLRVFAIRVAKGRSPFSPDKNHIHHILSSRGLSSISVVTIMVLVNLLFVIVGYMLKDVEPGIGLIVIISLALLFSVFLEFYKNVKR